MKVVLLSLCVLAVPAVASSTETHCGSPAEIPGTYKTDAPPGYAPNVLVLTSKGKSIRASLLSYWAPGPNDDGRRGTVGEFGGIVKVPMPWSCTATFEHQQPDEPKGSRSGCKLVMTFLDPTHVIVRTQGHCELYHGNRAVPDGTYVKGRQQ